MRRSNPKSDIFIKIKDALGGYIFFFAVLLFYEALIRVKTLEPFWNAGILKIFAACLLYALALNAPASLLPKKASDITKGALLAVIAVIYISQLIFYGVFGTFYSLARTVELGGVLANFWRIILNALASDILYIILYLLPAALYFIIIYRYGGMNNITSKKINAAAALSAQTVLLLLLAPCIIYAASAYSVKIIGYGDYNSKANNIGVMSSMHLDFLKLFVRTPPAYIAVSSDYAVNLDDVLAGLLPAADPGSLTPPSADGSPINLKEAVREADPEASLSVSEKGVGGVNEIDAGSGPEKPAAEPEPVISREFGYNILPHLDFAALAAAETDGAVRAIHEYFAAVSPTEKNGFTGMFAGYNLVFITAESLSAHAIREDITPTLYKMATQGFGFNNFYTSVGHCTSAGEFAATTGLATPDGGRLYQASIDKHMPMAMGNMLRPLGYKTMAYHNHSHTFLSRHLSHPNMGYEFIAIGSGLEISRAWPRSDLEMFEATIGDYINNQPFHAYYMTVSGHFEYNFSGANSMSSKNRKYVEHLPYPEKIQAYLAAQIELDRALGHLLERLREAGIAEKTLIVIVADHYPYNLTVGEISQLAGHEIEPNFELWKNALIIYAEGMDPVTVDKPASSMDILPTVYNLMGLEFDSRLFMGRDILSGGAPLVIFRNWSFITDIGRYNAASRTFEPDERHAALDIDFNAYRSQVSAIAYRKTALTRSMIELDYYRFALPP
jgi:hypothetical protein